MNVRGEIGEMLGQGKTAGDGGGGPVTRVLVRQPSLSSAILRSHAIHYLACTQRHCLSAWLGLDRLHWHVLAGYKCFQGFGAGGGGRRSAGGEAFSEKIGTADVPTGL